jgi:CBS domain-containing protein
MDIKKLRVRDLMRSDVKTVNKNALLLEAARHMREMHVTSLVIEPGDDSDAFGIITQKDILNVMLMAGEDDFTSQVGEAMTKPAITVGPTLSIENCLLLMRVAGARRLPVVEGQKLIGIISNTDVFERLVEGSRE